MKINNFTTIESQYGRFIVNRHCAYQAEVLIKTGKPHIEEELRKVLAIIQTLDDGCVAVDAGANIGLVAIPVAQALALKGGHVIAFEPQRMMAYALCGAVALNDLENIEVRNQGLGADTGTLKGQAPNYSAPQDFGLYSLADQAKQGSVEIEVVTIDSLALERLGFLKIDVEGMEVAVLEGAKSTIQQCLPWCWVEYWQVGIDIIKAQFFGLDYRFYVMDDLNLLCAPVSRLEKAPLNINAKQV